MLAYTSLLLPIALAVHAGPDAQRVDDLLLIERPAAASIAGRSLVVLMTGDGGFANADRKVTDALVAHGASVVGLDLRAYLQKARTPDETAADVGRIMHHYLEEWKQERIILVGYSRGADLAPFVAARLPEELRARVDLVAMIGISSHANFHFHWVDLVRDTRRPDDLPTGPELSKLRGLKALCVYGTDETDSGCRSADSTIVERYPRDGGHRLSAGFDAVADLIVKYLTAPR